jgi:hypothetical protein
MLTIVDPQEYSPDEYNIVGVPSKPLSRQAVHIQQQLAALLGDIVWFTPAHALHMTVIEITGPFSHPIDQRARQFAQWKNDYSRVVKDMVSQFSPITLHFNQVLASQRAIILKAADPTPLNALREAILSKTKLPEGAKLPPDIAHISLARFGKAVDLERVIKATQKLSVDHNETIASFSLWHDITPPDFNVVSIDTYPFVR